VDYRWKVTNTGRGNPRKCVSMVAQIHRRSVPFISGETFTLADFSKEKNRFNQHRLTLCRPYFLTRDKNAKLIKES